jgi:asparagine synthase (glutamine-hydrolysing)
VRALAAAGLESCERYDRWMSYFTREDLDRLYEPTFASHLPALKTADSLLAEPWRRTTAGDTIDTMLDVDVQTYLPGDLLVKMDIASMAHSLEVRSPLLDHVLMERAAQMPSALKLRRGVRKALLKEAVGPWLPGSVTERPKMGFGVPIGSWLRNGLRDLPGDVLLDPAAVGRGMFRTSEIRRLIDDHHSGATDNSAKLWSLLQLELWFRTYIDSFEQTPLTIAAAV